MGLLFLDPKLILAPLVEKYPFIPSELGCSAYSDERKDMSGRLLPYGFPHAYEIKIVSDM